MADAVFVAVWLVQYLILLADGQIPPRFSLMLLGHLGYPIFVFSYHLPFILGSLFSALGFNLTNSLKLVFGLSLWWSGLGMYLLLRQWFKPLPSFVGAFLFLAAPYRLLLIFVRAAVGEALALSLLPWLLLAFHKKNVIFLGFITALATLSHSLFWPMYLGLVFISHNVDGRLAAGAVPTLAVIVSGGFRGLIAGGLVG